MSNFHSRRAKPGDPAAPAKPVGQSQVFTVLATDASGIPVPNANIVLSVGDANLLQLNDVTDANGQVSFTYTGANAGTERVEAFATISSMFAMSNVVTPRTQKITWARP